MAITSPPSSQAVNATPTVTSTTHTVSPTATAGDLIVVCSASRDNQAISTVSGSVDGAFTRAGAANVDGNGHYAEIWYFANSAGGAQTITVTYAATARAGLNASCWSGAATSSVLDQNSENDNATGTAHHHGSITTTGAGLIVTCLSTVGAPGAITQTNFTALTDNAAQGYDRSYFGYRIVTGSTAEDGDLTTTNSVASAGKIASFNEAAAGGAVSFVPAILQNYRNMRLMS